MSADPTAPGGDLGASRHVPVGSGTLSGVAAARAPQLPAADIGLAPALQAYVADFVARTHAASSQ
jgi:hypothetical protein